LSGSQHSVRVGFRTPSIAPTLWELVTAENLARFGKTANDVQSVTYSEYYPGNPYTELNLAGTAHPIIGSGSALVGFKDGSSAAISDIFYEDLNPNRDHCNGQPHWNLERRFEYDKWSEPQFDKHPNYHCIPQSAWIETLSEEGSGSRKRTTLLWK